MKKTRYRKNYSSLKLILILLLTLAFVISISFSKYKANVTKKDSAKIALMANSAKATISSTVKPGSVVEQPIKITNYDENNKICEVAENFKIVVTSTNNLPLNFKLYKDENYTQEIKSSSDGTFESTDFSFSSNGKKQETTCYLRISWPETSNNYTYSSEMDNVEVGGVLTQIN